MKTSMTAKLLLAALLSCAWLGCATNKALTPRLVRLYQSELEKELRAVLHEASSQILKDPGHFSITTGNGQIEFRRFNTPDPSERNYLLSGGHPFGFLKAKVRNGQLVDIEFEEGALQISTGMKARIDVLE